MTSHVEYTCKFCKRTFGFDCDIHPDCPPLKMSEWIGLLACNECADYESLRRTLESLISDQCISWFRIDWAAGRNEIKADRREQLRGHVYANLVTLTRRYTSLVCHRFNVGDAWESEFVQMLMDRPQEAQKCLHGYIKVTAAAARRSKMAIASEPDAVDWGTR